MASLYEKVDVLSSLGYTQLQLYMEHTFAYSKHETVWRYASPMTAQEVMELDEYCAKRGIELVPSQNSFGHMERWLRHPEYNYLAEVPMGGAKVPQWGDYTIPTATTLSPTNPDSLKLIAGLYDELLPCFKSKKLNVGCDETLELMDSTANGRSAKEISELGWQKVYFDFLMKIHQLTAERGHEMMFWGDILIGYPDLVKQLPKDVIALIWGYEATQNFDRDVGRVAENGGRFYVCPGTSAWGSLFGRVSNMIGNVDRAIEAADKYHAEGILLADWGDGGNPNPWIVSLPGIVYTAYRARGKKLSKEELAHAIDEIAGAKCGAALLEIGEVYKLTGGRTGNSTELFLMLRDGVEYVRAKGVDDQTLANSLQAYRNARAKAELSHAKKWVKDDFETLDLLAEAIELRLKEPKMKNFRAVFEPRYRELWLRQNRVGGLEESLNWIFGRMR